jgi:ferredoxin
MPGEAAPALFEIDDNEEMRVIEENPSEDLRQKVEAAVANCPRQALSLHR